MKKTILIFLLSIVCVSAFAQTISFRNESDDYVSVATDYLTTTHLMGGYETGVALSMYKHKQTGEQSFFIGLYSEGYGYADSQKNSRAVFKTFAGSIMTVVQIDSDSDVRAGRRMREEGSSICALRAHYSISEQDLQTLMNEGVALLRIETSAGIREFTYNKDNLGKYLQSEYNLLLSYEKNPFENDF